MTEKGCLNNRLFYVRDRNSDLHSLIGISAALCNIPQNQTELYLETYPVILQAANKAKIATFGQKTSTLDLGFRRRFLLVFTTANLDLAILGVEVSERHEFVVDTERKF
ncbi:family A2 unassigned peptidase (A02 family) [Schistosoma mansoni]|uniref:family A2 unassigned peptidase (A02 family) n=1 Tax=Schistosoma mansoni TaxID=6183 RepID=UPI0001A63A03|nr:family A2 unassigned peptidase (A02 family) [Schistosoma mansoni]|eukprot:XP_018653733.1 family A2 unassigned peptidase (A02 family) [Schistosoma mansoni]